MTSSEFKQLILPLKNKLFRFAQSFVSREDAEDVVQDVMIKCWEDIDRPQQIDNIEAFSMKMVRNKSLDKLKKKGRNYLQVVDQYQLHSREKDPHEKTGESETISKIKDIISLLPQKQRNVINLRDIEGYSYNEIAETLEMSTDQVKVNLHRARVYVREQMKKINAYGIS
ncbi:MAG: RNA polymerase sigma factor [Bacteroidota bacterium]